MTELLLQTPPGLHVEARLFRDGDELHPPHLLDVEVVQALRRLVHAGDASLMKCDGPLDAAPGHAARIDVIR